jgi:hypothetical protein
MVTGRAALAPSTVDTTAAAMGATVATVDATGPVPEDGGEVAEDGGEVPEDGGEPTELTGVACGVAPAPFETELAGAVEPLAADADVVPASLELSEPTANAALGAGAGVKAGKDVVTAFAGDPPPAPALCPCPAPCPMVAGFDGLGPRACWLGEVEGDVGLRATVVTEAAVAAATTEAATEATNTAGRRRDRAGDGRRVWRRL